MTRAIFNADAAYKMWWDAKQRGDNQWGRPRAAKHGVNERFYVHNKALRFDGQRVRIGRFRKLGWLRCHEEFRYPEWKVIGGSARRKADGWYLSVQAETETDDPRKHDDTEWQNVRKAQTAVANKDIHGAWVDCDDLNNKEKNGRKRDDRHYTKEGYELLGRRYARQAKALIEGKKPAANGRPD